MKTRNYVFYIVKRGSFLDGEELVHCFGKYSHSINQGCLQIYDDGVLKSVFKQWSSFDIKHKTSLQPENPQEVREVFEIETRRLGV